MDLIRKVVSKDKIVDAINLGLENIQMTMDAVPHDMNREVMSIIKRHMGEQHITNDLFVGGVAIFYLTALQGVVNDFKSSHIPIGMADVFCNSILMQLKKLDGVGDYFNHLQLEVANG